jgi:hypothetical protein
MPRTFTVEPGDKSTGPIPQNNISDSKISAQDGKLPNRFFLVASTATEHKHKRTFFVM